MNSRQLATLAATEVVIVSVFLLPLHWGATGVRLLALALGMICANELAGIQRAGASPRVAAAVIAALAFAGLSTTSTTVVLAAAIAMLLLLTTPLTGPTLAVLTLYPVVFAALMPALFTARHGVDAILVTYIVTESCDSFALLIGKTWGRRKPFRISPNKSIEGVAGGILGATVIGTLVGRAVNWPPAFSVGLSLLLACTAVAGDLAASRIKRARGVKDFGHVLPLQGGVLDIYDSALFNLPVTCLALLGTGRLAV